DKAWALVGPETVPVPWPKGLPTESLRSAPEGPEALAAWHAALGQLLGKEATLEQRADARLVLCLIAQAQARHQDAWQHLIRLTDHPGHTLRAVPYLWPGVPLGTQIGAGGRVSVPAGTLFTPAFPPQPPAGQERPLDAGPQTMAWLGLLEVGGQRLDLRATLPNTGLELELTRPSQAVLHLLVCMPAIRNYERDLVYSDWDRMNDSDAPVDVVLPADRATPWTLFARLRPNFEPWPASPAPGSLWRRDRSLALVVPAGSEVDASTQALAGHLAAILDLPVACTTADQPLAARTTAIDLGQGPERTQRIRRLLSAVEGFTLDS
ncbi:MAG TPA: hypothetical protein PLJ12_15345, partial [Planctomycetota bacterium]|nr:hypothetical protein [Planctomycetota bacterium]